MGPNKMVGGGGGGEGVQRRGRPGWAGAAPGPSGELGISDAQE